MAPSTWAEPHDEGRSRGGCGCPSSWAAYSTCRAIVVQVALTLPVPAPSVRSDAGVAPGAGLDGRGHGRPVRHGESAIAENEGRWSTGADRPRSCKSRGSIHGADRFREAVPSVALLGDGRCQTFEASACSVEKGRRRPLLRAARCRKERRVSMLLRVASRRLAVRALLMFSTPTGRLTQPSRVVRSVDYFLVRCVERPARLSWLISGPLARRKEQAAGQERAEFSG